MSHPVIELTRIEKVSTSHRLHSPHLSSEENEMVFGKCNNPHGHGHNYTVEVTVRGIVDDRTGMVMNMTDLKDSMKLVLDQIDHKCLDKDVDFFKTNVSTTEMLTVFVWRELLKHLPLPDLLYCVKIHETDKNIATFYGVLE